MQPRPTREQLAVLLAILVPVPAAAQYLDPGAASIIVQAVVGVIVAVAAGLKLYWGKVSGFFSRRRPRDDGAP